MKKIFFFITILLFALQLQAQRFNSIAIVAGVTAANQKFLLAEPPDVSRKNYVVGFNVAVFGEFFTRDYVRWVTEIQYNQKGSIDNQPEANYPNQLQYICWNNYAKIRYEMDRIIPYILIGPRLEYNMVQSTTSPLILDKFLPLHISGAVGAGVEFINYYNIKFFVEGFYNPDVMPAYVQPELHVFNKDFELRVGLKYEFKSRRESCNTPTYVEP